MAEIYRQKPPARGDLKKEEKLQKESRPNKYRQKVDQITGKSGHPFSAFLPRPKHLSFEGQYDNEEIILLLRKHLITQINWVLAIIAMILAPLVLMGFPLIDFLPSRFQFVVILMWYLLVFAFFLESFLGWYFHVFILTDKRVVDIDFYNLIYREVSVASIEKIEDVTVKVGGVIQTIFDFGIVVIQTAAQMSQLEFEYVPQPGKVSEVLKQLILEKKKRRKSNE